MTLSSLFIEESTFLINLALLGLGSSALILVARDVENLLAKGILGLIGAVSCLAVGIYMYTALLNMIIYDNQDTIDITREVQINGPVLDERREVPSVFPLDGCRWLSGGCPTWLKTCKMKAKSVI